MISTGYKMDDEEALMEILNLLGLGDHHQLFIDTPSTSSKLNVFFFKSWLFYERCLRKKSFIEHLRLCLPNGLLNLRYNFTLRG